MLWLIISLWSSFAIVQSNVFKLFPSILFATFQMLFESPVYGLVPMTQFCHHFVTN